MEGGAVGHNLKGTHPRSIPARFGFIWFSGSIMMSFLAYITGFFMNFELLPILTLKKKIHRNPEYMLNYSLPCSCS
jgi:hypothetical protein